MKRTTKIMLGVISIIMLISLITYIRYLNTNNSLDEKIGSNSISPVEVKWELAIEILNTGNVTEVVQSHNLEVLLTLKDGSQIKTVEPSLDDIFAEIERCGPVCSEISLMTE